jgi:hypothetical protein
LVDNGSNQDEELIDDIEDSELEISDDEKSFAESTDKIDMDDTAGNINEEVIEINDDVFVEEIKDEAAEEQQLEENNNDEEPENKIDDTASDDDTLSGIIEDEFESDRQKIDMTDLVQNKKMTKIIEVVFDYDMEDYSNTIEQISACSDLNEANKVLDKLYSTNRVNSNSKEAHLFKELISEYFN